MYPRKLTRGIPESYRFHPPPHGPEIRVLLHQGSYDYPYSRIPDLRRRIEDHPQGCPTVRRDGGSHTLVRQVGYLPRPFQALLGQGGDVRPEDCQQVVDTTA